MTPGRSGRPSSWRWVSRRHRPATHGAGARPLPPAGDRYIRQAALGLQHAFEHGLVHRDVKPSNLLVVPGAGFGTVKVLDLGLRVCQAVRRLRQRASPAPAGSWAPPTSWRRSRRRSTQCGCRADLYSLGCTYYFLLTGRPPFPGGSFLQKLNRHREAAPPALRADVPAPVADVVARLLRKRPEERATPAELARCSRQCSVAPDRLATAARRALIAGIAAVGAASLGIGAVIAWRSRGARPDRPPVAKLPDPKPIIELPCRRALRSTASPIPSPCTTA